MIIVPSLTTVSKASKELLQKSQNDSIIICMHDVCMCVQSNIVGPLLRVLK